MDDLWRWEATINGWQYRVEMIPRTAEKDSGLIFTKQLSGSVRTMKWDIIQKVSEGELGWKEIPLSLADSGTIKVRLLYSALTSDEKNIIANPEASLSLATDGGAPKMKTCNVWRIVTDEGTFAQTGTATWTTLFEGGQRRGGVNRFETYNDGTVWLEIELFDILRVVLERYKYVEYGGYSNFYSLHWQSPSSPGTYYIPFSYEVVNHGALINSGHNNVSMLQSGLGAHGILTPVMSKRSNITEMLRIGMEFFYRQLTRNMSATCTFLGDGFFNSLKYFSQAFQASGRVGSELGTDDTYYVPFVSNHFGISGATWDEKVVGGMHFLSKQETLLDNQYAFDFIRDLGESEFVKITHRVDYATNGLKLYINRIENPITASPATINPGISADKMLPISQGENAFRTAQVQLPDLWTDDRNEYELEQEGSSADKQYNVKSIFHNVLSLNTDNRNRDFKDGTGRYYNPNLYVRGVYYKSGSNPSSTLFSNVPAPWYIKVHEKVKVYLSDTESTVIGSDIPCTDISSVEAFRGWLIEQQKLSSVGYAIAKFIIDTYGLQNQVVITGKFQFIPGLLMPYSLGEMYNIAVPEGMTHKEKAILLNIKNIDFIKRTMTCSFLARGNA